MTFDATATLDDLAREYVALLRSPANGLGQNVHPRYGISHRMLRRMWEAFGQDAVTKAVEDAFDAAEKTDQTEE